MPLSDAAATAALTVHQRCFYLFCALLALFVALPFLEGTPREREVFNALSLAILIASVGAIGRSASALIVAVLLAAPAAAFQVVGVVDHVPRLLPLSQAFVAGFYAITIGYLLVYTLQREVLTLDKLYGAAAAYLMLGILWAYLYNILLSLNPGALSLNGTPVDSLPPSSILYFSFVNLTSTGMGDVLPAHPIARMLCMFEMIIGVLFIAVLIARLVGSYPPPPR